MGFIFAMTINLCCSYGKVDCFSPHTHIMFERNRLVLTHFLRNGILNYFILISLLYYHTSS
jgi:hypothetical protein